MSTIQLRLRIDFYADPDDVATYLYSLKHNSGEYQLNDVNHNFINKLLAVHRESDYHKVILGEYVELRWDISQHDYDLIFTLYVAHTDDIM
jgi:hypothetical protein